MYTHNSKNRGHICWCKRVIPVIWKVETRGLQVQTNSGQLSVSPSCDHYKKKAEEGLVQGPWVQIPVHKKINRFTGRSFKMIFPLFSIFPVLTSAHKQLFINLCYPTEVYYINIKYIFQYLQFCVQVCIIALYHTYCSEPLCFFT